MKASNQMILPNVTTKLNVAMVPDLTTMPMIFLEEKNNNFQIPKLNTITNLIIKGPLQSIYNLKIVGNTIFIRLTWDCIESHTNIPNSHSRDYHEDGRDHKYKGIFRLMSNNLC